MGLAVSRMFQINPHAHKKNYVSNPFFLFLF